MGMREGFINWQKVSPDGRQEQCPEEKVSIINWQDGRDECGCRLRYSNPCVGA